MADEIINEVLFQKGFNHAYYLQKDEKGRSMLTELEEKNNNTSYGKGLEKGKQEAKKEEFINDIRKSTEKGKER